MRSVTIVPTLIAVVCAGYWAITQCAISDLGYLVGFASGKTRHA